MAEEKAIDTKPLDNYVAMKAMQDADPVAYLDARMGNIPAAQQPAAVPVTATAAQPQLSFGHTIDDIHRQAHESYWQQMEASVQQGGQNMANLLTDKQLPTPVLDEIRRKHAAGEPVDVKDIVGAFNEGFTNSPGGQAMGAAFNTLGAAVNPAVQGIIKELDKLGVPHQYTEAALNLLPAAGMVAKGLKGGAEEAPQALGDIPQKPEQSTGVQENAPIPSAASQSEITPQQEFAPETAKPVTEEEIAAPKEFTPGFNFGAEPKITDEIKQNVADYLAGKTGTNPIQASTENWNNPITRDTLKQISSYIPDKGVLPDDAVRQMAFSLGESVEDLTASGRSRILDVQEMQALKIARDATALRTQEIAAEYIKMQGDANADPVALDTARAKLNASMAVARDTSEVFEEQGTKTARTLRIRRGDIEPGKSSELAPEYINQVNDLIKNTQYSGEFDEVARRLAMLDNPAKASGFLGKLNGVFSRDNVVNAWYQMLLSNPEILGKKQGSDLIMFARDLGSTFVSEKTGALPDGTALAKVNAYLRSYQDGFSAFAKAWKAGRSLYGSDYQDAGAHDSSFYRDEYARGYETQAPGSSQGEVPETPRQSFGDVLKANMPWPSRVIGALDDMNKVLRERASISEQLYVKGMEQGLKGSELKQFVAEGVDNPSFSVTRVAKAEALRGTLQEPMGELAASIASFTDNANIKLYKDIQLPVGKMVLPFIRIASNTMREAYRSSPFYLASDEFSGLSGVARSKATALVGLGTAYAAATLPFIINGHITGGGPANPEMRKAWLQAGNQPYSVKVGNTWYGYRWVEPMGFMQGLLADTVETMKYASTQDGIDLAASFVRGAGNALLNASYLGGAAEFLDSMLSKQPGQSPGRYFSNLEASMVVPSGAKMIAQGIDPYMREHHGFLETVQSRLPYASEHLQPVLDTWGYPVKNQEHLLRGLIPMNVKSLPADSMQPVDKWIWEHYRDFPRGAEGYDGITRPQQTFTHSEGGVKGAYKLTPEQYTRYQQLAGHLVKNEDGLGADAYLNSLVKGNNPDSYTQNMWNEANDEKRALMVHQKMSEYRKMARDRMYEEYPEIERALEQSVQTRSARINGVAQ